MPRIYPTSEEQRVMIGEVLLKRHENFKECKKGEWIAGNAKSITFTDKYITYLDNNSEWQHYDLTEWFVEIYTHDIKYTHMLLCRKCGHRNVSLKSTWDERYNDYYHHESTCYTCDDKVYPTGKLRFILNHWESDIENQKKYEALRNKKSFEMKSDFENQMNIFEYLDEIGE